MSPSQPELHDIAADLDGLLPTGAGLLVALSGGADSVLTLRAAVERRQRTGAVVEAAHLHHGLRGADADADQEFCRRLCDGLDVPLHCERLEHADGGPRNEAALRRRRHAFLIDVLTARPHLIAIATGHHADDQAETVLMRLFRGAGPDGLAAMRAREGHLVRPLLERTRDQVLATLDDLGQKYRTDNGNVGGDNLRARMRRDLRPVLDQLFGASAVRGPARLAGIVTRDAEALETLAAARLQTWRDGGLPPDSLPRNELLELPPGLVLRLVRAVVDGLAPGPSPLEADRLSALSAWLPGAKSGSLLELSGGWSVQREFDRLRLRHGPVEPNRAAPRLKVEENPAGDVSTAPEAGPEPPDGCWTLTCPVETLCGRPRLRPWRSGDRLRPFGLDGSKKVSDLLREARIPRSARSRVWLVEDDAGPLWLTGVARDERTRLLPTTDRTVTLTVNSRESEPLPDDD